MTTNNGTPSAPTASPSTDVSAHLDRFRGRAPSEMLGLPRQSGLLGAFAIASVCTLVLFVVLTLVPYLMAKQDAAPQAPADAAQAEAPKADPTPKQPKPATPAPATAKADTPAPVPAPTAKGPDISKTLGESDVKTASPKVNPLDKKDDDLLKILDK